tara:strand:+ start:661 stop:912 length:252 start_codon:yes stop_codon:yes gene_type:complete
MSKVLDKLINSDDRFDKLLGYHKNAYGYHVWLSPKHRVNEFQYLKNKNNNKDFDYNRWCIFGETVKDVLSQLKYIEEATWEVA